MTERVFKHVCTCGAVAFIPVAQHAEPYPKCCGIRMLFWGTVDGIADRATKGTP